MFRSSLDRILILDFGSQYAQLIARRVRELHVYCEIMPGDVSCESIETFQPNGIILSGGPETVTVSQSLRAPEIIFQLGCPLLGICYGMHAMAFQLGGAVEQAARSEFGQVQLYLEKFSELFFGINNNSLNAPCTMDVWMSHGDVVTRLPPGFDCLASSDNAAVAVMADVNRQWFGVQFHPEVTHTPNGLKILENFVRRICQCEAEWIPSRILEERVRDIQQLVDKDSVIMGISGGVDSAVAATLIHRAVGDQLTCVFVDTGLLRRHEKEEVIQILSEQVHLKLKVVDARHQFLNALEGVSDSELKRKIIGREFIQVFEREATQLRAVWLGQGTIYPDIIESAKTPTGKSHVIKTHHNVGGLPSAMSLKLLEPLRELFKDEVRQLGLLLGLPKVWVFRHPFPGPGLAIRVLGEVKPDYLDILRDVDAIFIEELRKQELYSTINQAFAVFIPLKSVGVKGDARHEGYIVALRAVETIDFMTARWSGLPYEFLSHVSHRIVNEVRSVSRVVYDITNKPPATIEWE